MRLCRPAVLALCLALPCAAEAPSPDLGQLVLAGFRGLDLDEDPEIRDLVCRRRVGGVALFHKDVPSGGGTRNVLSPEQLKGLTAGLQKAAKDCGAPPLLVAVDEEGGWVRRLKPALGFPAFPSHEALGLGAPEATEAAAAGAAAMLRSAGIQWNLAPVVDVAFSTSGPIAFQDRAFSADPAAVTEHARAYIRGLRSGGILNCLKHFPGLGSASEEPPAAFADVTAAHDPRELEPFRALAREGLADCVMAAHARYGRIDPGHAAVFSSATLSGLLRGELAFDGVVLSGDLQRAAAAAGRTLEEAAVESLAAGADMVLVPNNGDEYDPDAPARVVGALAGALRSGRLDRAKVDASLARVAALKQKAFGKDASRAP